MKEIKSQKRKLDYKWVIVAASFLMVFTVLGFCSSAKSLYVVPICNALNIERSLFSINDSCRYVTTSIINLFFGLLIGKFGARKLVSAGFICLIISSFLYSVAPNIYVFYAGGVFLGLGVSWTTTTMVGSIVGRWCKENKGTVMGFILASNGIGAALAMQILTPIIYREGDPFAYQDAYRIVTLILIVVGIIVVALLRDKPKDEVGEVKFEAKKKKPKGESWVGIEYSEATKRIYFYGAIVCIFFTGMVLQGISGVAAPRLTDAGLSAGYVATVMSAHSIALTVFKFLTGFMYDKFGLRITTNTCLTAGAVTMALLALVTNTPEGRVIAMIYGVFSSLALPLETVMLPIFANDLFGEKSFDKVMGIFAAACTSGFALGSPVANACFDILGSYDVALYASCGILVLVTLGMHFVINTAHKERKKIAAVSENPSITA